MATAVEATAMRRALELAALPEGRMSPNPRVGAVVLDTYGQAIAEGCHRGPGTPHAEVEALQQAGTRSKGATVVVTLEPCHHSGRTGPCTRALVEAGVRRVVYAQADPNPVAAGGAADLQRCGVAVEAGLLRTEAEALNRRWGFAVAHGRPFVTWKFATTLDGRSAAADGTSSWITGPDARRDVHRLRAEADAILVGTGTVRADNPRLTVRDDADQPLPAAEQSLRVVVGRSALSKAYRVWDDAAETVQLRSHDVRAVLAELYERGVRSAWLEGGPTLAGAFLAAGVVDEIVAYVAPALLGSGAAALDGGGVGSVTDMHRLQFDDISTVGNDLRLIAHRVPQAVL